MEKVVQSLENAFDTKVRVEGDIAKVNVKRLDSFAIRRLNNFNADRFKGVVEGITVKPSNGGLAIWVYVKND